MKYIYIIFIVLISGCSTYVPVTDVSKTPKATIQQAYKVKIYTIDSSKAQPEILTHLGNITAYSCKHLAWDPPASKGNALLQLRLEALKLDADGVIDVTFDSQGTDAWGTNCWESVQASGVAVKFKEK